jgi:TatA/E family protein of Tat protein translocase
MPFGIGQWELLILGAVIVFVFGSARLPRIGRDLGKSLREMRETIEGVDPRKSLRELEPGSTAERPAERRPAERRADPPA